MTAKTCECGAAVFGDFCYKCMKPTTTAGIEVTHDDRRKGTRRVDDDVTDFYKAYGKLELNYESDDICTVTLRCSTCQTVFISMSTPANSKAAALPISAIAHTCTTKVRP